MSTQLRTFRLRPHAAFSLRDAAAFDGRAREELAYDGVTRLAFCVEGGIEHAGVEVRARDGALVCALHGDAKLGAVRAQTARMLSLLDASRCERLGHGGPRTAAFHHAILGLRLPVFASPYEAALWVVLGHRRHRTHADAAFARLGAAYGRSFVLAGRAVVAAPAPAVLAGLGEVDWLAAERFERVRAVARAALAGDLRAERLRASGPAGALASLQRIRGIGPYDAHVILSSAVGFSSAPADTVDGTRTSVRAPYDARTAATPAMHTDVA